MTARVAWLVAASFLCALQAHADPTTNLLPAYNDAYVNWQHAGLLSIGGIPNRTTQCGSTISPSGITPGNAGDDASVINAAIAACPAGQVVQLSAGTFKISMSQIINLGLGVTLRGTSCMNAASPFCSTVLSVYNGALAWTGGKCGVDTSHEVACVSNPAILVQPAAMSNQFDYGWASCGHLVLAANCGAARLAADVAQGATTVQVNSTTGFSVGMWVLIDEASGATWQNDPVGPNLYGQVWAAPDWLNASGSPATGRVQWAKYSVVTSNGDMGTGNYPYNAPGTIQTFYDRATSEIHLVSAIGAGPCPGVNCTITFDDPLTIAYRQSGAGSFTGTIAGGGTTLITSGDTCAVTVGQIVADTTLTVADGTYITAVNSCAAGAGNYTVSIAQTVASETMIWGAHQAHVYFPAHQNGTPMAFISQAGVENLTVSGATNGAVNFLFCAYCWMKNVEGVNWFSGVANFTYVARNQMDTSLANNCAFSVNSGAEYPIGIQDSSTEVYVVNSITRLCGKGLVGKAGAAAVVAYNYIDDTMYDSFSGIGDWFVDMGVNGSHWAGTHHFLFEGNWGDNLDNDDTHGNQVYHTYFRNWGTALRTAFTDPSNLNRAVNDATGAGWSCGTTGSGSCVANTTAPLRAAGPMLHDYWDAYVGNVLGTAGITTAGNGWTYKGSFGVNVKNIWMLGWNSDANNPLKSDPNLNGVSASYIHDHANYDYVNASQNNFVGGFSHTLVPSFYLAAKPDFFNAGSCYPWPWVTPDAVPVIQVGPPGCGGVCSGLPAQARWQNGTPFRQP